MITSWKFLGIVVTLVSRHLLFEQGRANNLFLGGRRSRFVLLVLSFCRGRGPPLNASCQVD